jgi:hypothetical protein
MNFTKFTFRSVTDASKTIVAHADSATPASDLVAPGYVLDHCCSAAYTHQKFAQEVAAQLSGTWTVQAAYADQIDSHFVLTRPDGMKLSLRPFPAYNRAGMGVVSMLSPRDGKGRYVTAYDPATSERVTEPSIKFAITKLPEQVAKDITRRLLPDCEAVYPLFAAAVKREDEYAAKSDLAAAAVKQIRDSGPLYFTANGASIDVKGYLTPEQAHKLAAFAATL